jgi:hypothetical protein
MFNSQQKDKLLGILRERREQRQANIPGPQERDVTSPPKILRRQVYESPLIYPTF